MTEQEWLAATDPAPMLEAVRGAASDRKLRLVACGVIRHDPTAQAADARRSVELGERWADGEAADGEVAAFRRATAGGADLGDWVALAPRPAGAVGFLVEVGAPGQAARLAHALRDIFGNPFRPATLDPSWLTSTVVALARQMYESRDFSPMPILADALQDAGCDDGSILGHCRGDTPHVRGCWEVDLVLGRE